MSWAGAVKAGTQFDESATETSTGSLASQRERRYGRVRARTADVNPYAQGAKVRVPASPLKIYWPILRGGVVVNTFRRHHDTVQDDREPCRAARSIDMY